MQQDEELNAIQAVLAALSTLESDAARQRVLKYFVDRMGLPAGSAHAPSRNPAPGVSSSSTNSPFATFAELFEAAAPESNADRALVAAYWVQYCEGAESFDAQRVNTELKHLGYGIANITSALDALKSQRPALVLQLRKSGTSQQSRKLYKVTGEGEKRVAELISRSRAREV